jgi:DNA uptake protein ComE-like DNA-binding protein
MSDSGPPSSDEWGWTRPQRRALAALLLVLLVVLSIRYGLNRAYLSDPQPPQGRRAGELASRVDPNSATWQELAAIPSLGEKRARQIVAYRQSERSRGPVSVVFRSRDDLMRVKGIGRATAENVEPYLIFPAERPPAIKAE